MFRLKVYINRNFSPKCLKPTHEHQDMVSFSFESIKRQSFCLLPTPIHPLKQLTNEIAQFGQSIYMKRDDLTGVGMGGNKNRKLEFLLADALDKEADIVITEGDVQSNHCRQTAACCARLGMKCELVLSGEKPADATGNFLLFKILDVPIHNVKSSLDRARHVADLSTQLVEQGMKPYIIPPGGSNEVGALGYVKFMQELSDQENSLGTSFHYLIIASGSAGTHAGVLIGKALFCPNINIIAVTVGDPEKLKNDVNNIINKFNHEHGTKVQIGESNYSIFSDNVASHVISQSEIVKVVKKVAQLEGLFLDPVYTGKAMAALIHLFRNKIIANNANVLFLNTGGGPTIFSHGYLFF